MPDLLICVCCAWPSDVCILHVHDLLMCVFNTCPTFWCVYLTRARPSDVCICAWPSDVCIILLLLFSETAVGCTASYFVKIVWCSCWFCNPPLILRLYIAYFAVAKGWLLLDIGWFVLYFLARARTSDVCI